jgi:hypothetical protein
MKMQLKEMSEDELDDIAANIGSEGFWYALTSGGYLKPEELISNGKDLKRLQDAIEVVKEFESLFPEV